ncbi:MAG TPA: hypothetical protein VLM18_11720 [Croceibacterium sp.]|nr:hypothetical protein [Croceibacterium sp.]
MRERIEDSKARLSSLGNGGMAARLAEEGEAARKALAKAFQNGDAPDDAAKVLPTG